MKRIVVGKTDAGEIERIDAVLRRWRQGDATLGGGVFVVHLADKRAPLTPNAREAAGEVPSDYNVFDVFTPVKGLVVVSQSCDIVRTCSKSEFVEVSPLVVIEDERQIEQIKKRRQIRYAYLPGSADRKLVADLERTMTVEKAVVAEWTRVAGCRTEQERATFADALVRKRGRFAFQDEFNAGLKRFRDRLKNLEGKKTPDGNLLAALDEVRVQAGPDWGATNVTVFFWFLAEREKIADLDVARGIVQNWMSEISWPDRFTLAHPAFIVSNHRT